MIKVRIITFIVVIAMLIGVVTQITQNASAQAATVASVQSRDTVLVLDESGSMSGEPMDKLIEAAELFCASVLGASGNNRIAVVTYSGYATLRCYLTNDMGTLVDAIESMGSFGMTNFYDALSIADQTLSNSDADVKNIVLMSDGLPNTGDYINDGQYDYSDYDDYSYANAVYDLAVSMHDSYNIYTLGFFHNLSDYYIDFASRFMEDLQNCGYYQVEDVEDIGFTFEDIAEDIIASEIQGTFKYPHGTRDYTSEFFYSDKYFNDDANTYKQNLATMSLCLAMSAFGSADVESYADKSINVTTLLNDLEFESVEVTDTYRTKPSTDSVAAAIGKKTIKDSNGDTYTLIAVAVRGGGYEQEWANNLTIGTSDEHDGFDAASEYVLDFIRDYIADGDNEIEGNIKLWITGYSRAAAVANLAAGKLDSGASLGANVELANKDLFAYCFETPAGTTRADANDPDIYGNIFNIINPNDIVTKLAPIAMGFRRYGIDRILPTRENKFNSFSQATANMLEQYNMLDSVENDPYDISDFSYQRVDLTNILPGGETIAFDAEEQMSMSAFLDECLSKLVLEDYITRPTYVAAIQDGMRELCKAIFQDESKAIPVLKAVGQKCRDNAPNLLWQFLWDEGGAYETVAGYLIEGLRDVGAVNFNENDIRQAARPLMDRLIAYFINHLDFAGTILVNNELFLLAHNPELCLAWMRSFDANYLPGANPDYSNGSYRIIRINCPVDVEIYDVNGNLIAKIIDDEVQPIQNGVVAIINSDGEKVIYLPADAGVNVVMTGTDDGSVNYSINEYSHDVGQVNRIVSYYDVDIGVGQSLNAFVPAYDTSYLLGSTASGTNTVYSLTDVNGNILIPDVDVSGFEAMNSRFTVKSESENTEYGIAIGSGVRQLGSYAKVNAYAKEGYIFRGWYEGEQRLSTDAEFRFRVTRDVVLIARFSRSGTGDSDLLILILITVILLLVVAGIILGIMLSGRSNKNNDDKSKMLYCPNCGAYHHYSQTCECMRKGGDGGIGEGEHVTVIKQQSERYIKVVTGSMAGATVPVKSEAPIYIGKDPRIANLVFSNDYINVSRMHCSVIYNAEQNKYYVVDTSSNGTYVDGSRRLLKGKRTAVQVGSFMNLANEDCTIQLL